MLKMLLCKNAKSTAILIVNVEYKYEYSAFNVNIWTVCIIKSNTNANNGIAATKLFFNSCDKYISNTVAIVTNNNVNIFVNKNKHFFPSFSFVINKYYHFLLFISIYF